MFKSIAIPVSKTQELSAVYFQQPKNKNLRKETLNLPLKDTPKTLVVMIHTFPGYKAGTAEIFPDLEFDLSQNGFDTLRFDFRGCGDSGGNQISFSFSSASRDLQTIIKWAEKQNYERIFYIAEGLGAPIALMNMHKLVRGLVFLWPAFDPVNTALGQVLQQAAVQNKAVEWEGQVIGSDFIKDLAAYEPQRHLETLNKPLLVQHGHDDEKIPISQLELLRRYAHNARRIELTTYDSGKSGLTDSKERETLLYHVRQFLLRFE